MGRNKSIQAFLLTLTGCSWMLLFLSITLSDHHAFKKYHAARQVTHPPPAKDQDPCALCWSATHDSAEGDILGTPSPTGETCWGSRLAWVVGVGGAGRVAAWRGGGGGGSGSVGGGGGRIGGVGAFYYYTLHTTLSALRLRLKRAQQVAGDVRAEVEALGERVAQLHQTLTTRFSPRRDPYHSRHHHTTTSLPLRPTSHLPNTDSHPTHTKNHPEHTISHPPHGNTHVNTKTYQELERAVGRSFGKSKYRVFPILALNLPDSTPSTITLPLKSISNNLPTYPNSEIDHRVPDRTQLHNYFTQRRTPLSVDSTPKVKRKLITEKRILAEGENSVILFQRQSTTKLDNMDLNHMQKESGTSERLARLDSTRSVLSVRDVSSVVSIVAFGEGGESLLAGLSTTYPGITVHLMSPEPPPRPIAYQLRLHVHPTTSNVTGETVLTWVLRQVITRYVVVADGATSLYGLERLVWAVENLGVWAAAGGLQAESGEWRPGCQTSKYSHYEAVWTQGRLGSSGGCLLCQALEGPFLALTVILRHLSLDSRVNNNARQLGLFLQAAHTLHMNAAVCPSSLFTLVKFPQPPTRTSLLSLARRHGLYSIQVPGQPKFLYSCSEVTVICSGGSLSLPPCCRKDLAALIRFTMDTCDAHGLLCELQEGSLLGAVKTFGVLPWERDADITFHTANFTALSELKDVFDRARYALHLTDNRWCCVGGRRAGGQGVVSSGRWRGELWSQHAMDSEDNLIAGRPRTRVEVDGSWVSAPSSPGQYARNRYGVEVYRHAQHWLDTGRESGWAAYEAGRFLPCSSPTHHACLDQYPPDGNLWLHPLCVN